MSEEKNIQENPEDRKRESPEEMQLNNTSTGENISPPESGNQQPETEINKSDFITSDIQNMEVHHHPNVEKKNLKEYLLEGIMIFLAVTMGFFAENIREHFTDVRIEKEYLSTYKQQLLINKEQLLGIKNAMVDYKPAVDSLADLFFQKNENKDLIKTARLVVKSKMLILTTIDMDAYQQLVNSGGFKYIHNIALKDTMAKYADAIKDFENYNSFILNYITQSIAVINSMEDWHDFFHDHTVEIMPYPELTERERRTMVAFNKARYLNAVTNELSMQDILLINEHLLKIVNEELNK